MKKALAIASAFFEQKSSLLFPIANLIKYRRNSSKYNTPSFRTRRHFSRHSYRGISLQEWASLAGGDNRHSHRKVSSPCYATRSPTKRTTLVGSLVLSVKFGTPPLVALRLEAPNRHIPFISTLRICCRLDKATPSAIINY